MNKYLAKKWEYSAILEIKGSRHFIATSGHWAKSGCKSIKNGGACAECAKNYVEECEEKNKEINLEGFEKYYFKNCKTYDEFCNNARKFQDYLANQFFAIDFKTAYLYCWIRLIFDTYNGAVINEHKILKMIEEVNGTSCVTRSATLDEDTKFKVDIVSSAKDTGKTVFYQIKPITFYRGCSGSRNKDLMDDLENILISHQELLKENPNSEIQWIFYDDKDSEVLYFYEPEEIEKLKKGI